MTSQPNKALGCFLIALMFGVSVGLAYALISGKAWQFLVWFMASDIALSVFVGTLITIAAVFAIATRWKVRP